MRLAIVAALAAVGIAIGAAFALGGGPRNAYDVQRLVSDRHGHASHADPRLVNAWGLAASPTGPWWTANEASSTSTLYSSAGRKQLLTVQVAGGPTGVAWYAGKQFPVSGGGVSDPARFIYACEDGKLRAWTPTVPGGWSTQSEVVVDEGGEAAVFRGVAVVGARVYATDFHNARVDVYDGQWHRVVLPGAFVDREIPSWYAPFGIQAIGGHVFVTYVYRAPVNGNDAPTGGYVDEFDADGRLIARVGHGGVLNAPWGLALAPRSLRALRRRPADRRLRRRPHQRLPASFRRVVVRRHIERPARQAARHQRPLGARFRERRHGGAGRHALLHLRSAHLARRDRARRARAARLDQSRVIRSLTGSPRAPVR